MGAYKRNRTMKVYEASKATPNGYRSVPQIRLEGYWLKDLDFEAGTKINVECLGGKIVITPANEVLVI